MIHKKGSTKKPMQELNCTVSGGGTGDDDPRLVSQSSALAQRPPHPAMETPPPAMYTTEQRCYKFSTNLLSCS